jgi:hypothetical protein
MNWEWVLVVIVGANLYVSPFVDEPSCTRHLHNAQVGPASPAIAYCRPRTVGDIIPTVRGEK